MSSYRKKAYLALLTTSLIWGLAPPIIKYTLGFISPLTYLFYRFLIVSTVLLIPLIIKLLKNKPGPRDCLLYLGLGFLGTPLTLILFFEGIKRTAAVNASIISIFTPVLIILGGVFFLKEQVTKNERRGIFLILLGASLSIVEPLFNTGLNFREGIVGNLLILAGSLCWASFSLLRRKFGVQLDSFILTASSFLIGLIVLLPLVHGSPAGRFMVHPNAFPGILYMSLLGSIIAYFTYIYGFSKIEASEATLFTYLEPVFAIPASIIFLGESVSPLFGLGAMIVIVGVLLAELLPALEVKPINRV
jgi:drug/metabolite transporter (DMT)-like permease